MSDSIAKVLPYSIDLNETIKKTELHTLFVMGDSLAHRFELTITNGSEAVDLTDATVTGYFTNFKEKTTITVTGKAEDGKVLITLNKPCYTLHGQFVLIIQVKIGDVEASVFQGEGFMRTSKSEKIVYDDYVVYDINTLLAQISAMKTAAENANKAAAAADAAAEHAPYINAGNNHWMAWDTETGTYEDTGVTATGPKGAAGDDGSTPYIGSNGNWWIGSTDTGTKAQGPAGQNGTGSGTVTGVEVNGQKYEPDQTGLVTLPEMGGSDVELSNASPKPLGSTASAGTGTMAAREDHVHKMPTAQDVGALPSSGTAKDSNKLGGVEASEYAKKTDLEGVGGADPLTIYPVGSIYVSVNSTSPASLFGGTWEQLKDRFLLGAGDSYAAGSTGGEAKTTIQNSNMPFWALYMGQSDTDGEWSVGKWNDYSVKSGDTIPKHYGSVNAESSLPLNNMPPYLAVYMWKRVS